MSIVVIGKSGNLASSLRLNSPEYIYLSREEYSTTSLDNIRPQYIINAAAYTNVDLAENERNEAIRLNAELPKELALWCEANKAKLIHISTDYVFDGTKNSPYTTFDIPNPINFYGYSKKIGEDEVLKNCENSVIIRTSWIYSPFGKNFVKTMVRLLSNNTEIKVVNDQIGCPTSSINLTNVINKVIKNFTPGLYHYADKDPISWYDFACKISKKIGAEKVIAITSDQYNTVARRPKYSVLDSSLICDAYDIKQCGLDESLDRLFHDYSSDSFLLHR